MSIYSTSWILRFPRFGEHHTGCDWVDVYFQAVPGHCGPASPGADDPFAEFLPDFYSSVERGIRAMVVVGENAEKSGQRYVAPLLSMSGREYFSTPFDELAERISNALRGDRPRFLTEFVLPDGTTKVVFDDDTAILIPPTRNPHE